MNYEDLTIDLGSAAGGGFEATVAVAPIADNRSVRFAKPVEDDLLAKFHASFDAPGGELEERLGQLSMSPAGDGRAMLLHAFQERLGGDLPAVAPARCLQGRRAAPALAVPGR